MAMLTRLARFAAGVLIFGLLLAGCVPTSENPILSKASPGDPALIGSWRGKMEDGAPVTLHILKTKEADLTALLVSTGEKAEADAGWSVFKIVTAEVKGTQYISALWQLNDGKTVEGRDRGHHLLRYAITPDGTLQMYGVNEEKLTQAVKTGKVKGTIEGEGTAAEVRLTASSADLAKFLKHANPADLFDKPFATLRKLAP
jgi:hypothetical protein